MNSPLRPLLVTLTLIFAMAAGAVVHGMALATPPRGQAGLQEIVICASGVAGATITIDAHGNRVDPAHGECAQRPCPDCLTTAAFALAPALSAPARAISGRGAAWPVPAQSHPERPYAHPAARGPPQKV